MKTLNSADTFMLAQIAINPEKYKHLIENLSSHIAKQIGVGLTNNQEVQENLDVISTVKFLKRWAKIKDKK